MKAVFLDAATVGAVDFQPLRDILTDIEFFDSSTGDEINQRIAGKDIVILNKTSLTAEILAQSKLKLICITATGTDNVDLNYTHDHSIAVRNVADYSTQSVAQIAFTLILALQSQLIPFAEFTQAGGWQRSSSYAITHYPFHELAGKTLGIIGYGNIGKTIANIAKQFGMKVLIANRNNAELQADRTPFNAVLQQADIITLHCPLTPQTKNLINAETLKLMQPHALLINTARGGIVDSQALATTLKQHKIAGAGIDVLPEEPPIHGDPLLDLKHPRLIITPHIAWAAIEARQRVIDLTANNIRDFLNKT